jgi:TIR domain
VQHQVLLSHAHRDGAAANVLADMVQRATLDQVQVWHSSDQRESGGILAGERWFDAIRRNMERSRVIVVLLTPTSLYLPWLYFEAGFGTALAEVEILPVCVGIDSLAEVPHPLAMYQSYQLSDVASAMTFMAKLCGRFGVRFDAEMARVVVEPAVTRILESVTGASQRAVRLAVPAAPVPGVRGDPSAGRGARRARPDLLPALRRRDGGEVPRELGAAGA